MKTFFVPSETVLHPETQEVLLESGAVYDFRVLGCVADDTGMDNIKGMVVFANSAAAAFKVIDNVNS